MKIFLSKIRTCVLAALMLASVALPVVLPQPGYAQNPHEKAICEGSGGVWNPSKDGGSCSTPGSVRTVPHTIRQIVEILIFIVGAVAVIMLVVGGLRYVLSGGEEKAVKAAKNTILYSIIGLIVTFASYAIVSFVLDNLGVK